MIFILDKSMNIRDSLSNSGEISHITPFFDDIYTSYLETGAETYQFSTLANTKESQHLIVGNHIAFQYEDEYKLFTITEIEETHDENFIKTVYCEMAGLKLINKVIRPIEFKSTNLRKFLEEILSDTDWNIGLIDIGLNNVCDIEIKDYTNAYSLLQTHIRESYNGEIHFTVKFEGSKATKYINVYSNRGQFDGFRFSYDSNLTSITRTINFDDLATALIGVGNNGLTFKEVEVEDKPLNQDFITDESAYLLWNDNGSHILGYEKFDTDSPQELLKLTREKLKERCQPKIKYELNPELLGETVKVGDTVYVIDNEFNPPIHLSARINQLSISLTDKSNNSCVLSNFTEITSNITEEMRQIASQLEGYVDGQFPIGGDKIQDGAINGDKLTNGQIIQGTHIFANSITADHIQAETIDTEHLKADSIDAEKIQANSITSNHIQSNTIETEHLKANIIQSEHIQSNTIDANHIISNSITSNHIQSNSINSEHIQTGSITAGSGIIANGAIGNAQISSINANKIDAGEIDTSKIRITGQDGFLFIENNTLYVVDGNRQIRCELGVIEDNSNYGFIVRGVDGETILLDHNGVRNAGITDGAIDNRTVSENANISGKKLDINSVIRTINEDGTVKIEGTKVIIGNKDLEVTLSEQNNFITEHEDRLSTQQSQIKANEESIKLKVDTQVYQNDKNEQNEKFNKHESSISILESQIINKVESSDIENALDEYGNVVDSKIQEKTSKLEQTDNSIKLSVSENIEKIKNSNNFIINSQALFTIEGFESLGSNIERFEYVDTPPVIAEPPKIPEQIETPPVDIPQPPQMTPPTTENNSDVIQPKPPSSEQIPKPPVVQTKTSTKIHFINTGQTGDCILIQTDNGKNIMIDSNYKDNAHKVVEYLSSLGVKRLDYIIVSHFHTDHAEGFPYILDKLDVKNADAYYRLPDFSKMPAIETDWKTRECWDSFRIKCNEKGVRRHEEIREKQRITISETSYLEFYNTAFENYSDYNSLSLVVLFVHGNKKYLLTGDINLLAQTNLIGKIGKVDMVKVPHHGYNLVINETWVKELNPRCWIATRTYAYENAYRDIGTLQVLGCPVYVQYSVGTHIVLTSTGNDFTLNTTKRFLFENCWCPYNNTKNWYWFKKGGNIAKNETIVIQGKKYKFNNSGICTNPYNPE